MISSLSESTNIPNLTSHTILVIGDVAADRQRYCQYLRSDLSWRYTILETNSLTTALVMCQNHPIDGILLDDTFPDRTGWEFLQALQQEFGDRHPPIVMVTDESNLAVPVEVAVQRAVRAMKLGVEDYLLKQTLTPECLQLAIQSAIEQTQLDISERKQIESERSQLLAEAEAANRSKDEFVALVAHELRSPLNAIMGWAKLLQTRQFDAVTTKKALETIVRNTQSQVQLVEDLLDISRMVRGTLHLTTTPVNLVNVIETTLETVRPTAEAKQIQLEAQIHNIAPVFGDFHRLQQLVLNLLTNSIKFTPEGGQVQVLLEQYHSQARIQVRDTGKGISPDFLPYIFERFRQDQQNTTAKQGLGLGLTIVKHIAEMHNGTVTVESQGEGQGATFTVMLPLLESKEVEEPRIKENTVSTSLLPHVSTTNSQSPLTKLRVLLVDDEPDMLSLTAFILNQYGAIAHTATNVTSALEELREFQPQILISDIAMPEQDGYVLLQQMRNIYPEGQIPAIALTAYASSSRQEQSLRAGFLIHLTKPVEPEALVKAILSTIERREP